MENVFWMKCVEIKGHNGTASLMIQVENLAVKGLYR
jgi:hypothetical protein